MTPEQRELIALLGRTREHLLTMRGLLSEESGSLQARNIGKIESLAAEKRNLAEELNQLAEKQRDLLAGLGHSADRAGVEACIEQIVTEGGDATLAEFWKELIELTAECKYQNEINGTYVGLLERYVEATLDLISGSPSQSETYSCKGSRTRATLSRRSFTV